MAHKKLDHLIAVSAASLGLLAGDVAAEHLTLDQEREIVAGRIATCNIVSVIDQHDVKPHEDGAMRDTLDVTIKFEDTVQSMQVRAKYENDDTVYWQRPRGMGKVAARGAVSQLPHSGDVRVMSNPLAEFESDEAGKHSFQLYPRDTYNPGDVMNVFVETEAMTDDDNSFTTTYTYANCGSLVLDAPGPLKGSLTWTINRGSAKLPAHSVTRVQERYAPTQSPSPTIAPTN